MHAPTACSARILTFGRARGSPDRAYGATPWGTAPAVFLFFSNRLGCLGSLLLSVVLTILLLAVLRLF